MISSLLLVSVLLFISADHIHDHCSQLGCYKLPIIGNQSFIISAKTGEQWPVVKCHGQTADDLLFYLDLLTYPKSYEDLPSNSKICSSKCWTIVRIIPPALTENFEACRALSNWIVVDAIWSANVDKLSYEEQIEEKFAVFGREIFCQAMAHNRECSENCTIHFPQCDPLPIDMTEQQVMNSSSLITIVISAIIFGIMIIIVYLSYEGLDFLCLWLKK